jgi:GWxTD domain-containing protein
MRAIAISTVVCAVFLVFPFPVVAQMEFGPPRDVSDLPRFAFDALVFAGSDTSACRLDVYVLVPYNGLRFVRDHDLYDARYEESVRLFDKDENLIVEKFSVEHIQQRTLGETTDPQRHNVKQRFFTVKPGRYSLMLQIRDEETRKVAQEKREIVVRPLRDEELSISDLMMVSQLRLDGGRRIVVPNVTGNIGDLSEGFHIFCEVYNSTECDTLEMSYRIKNAKNEERLHERFLQPVSRGTNQIFVKINSASLPMGTYAIGLQAAGKASGKQYAASTVSRTFAVRWSGIPAAIEDLNVAIDQLVYAAEPKELDHIKGGSTLEERRRRFQEFWKKRDPTPGTDRNEQLEQYYSRVAYANKNFSNYTEGWKSDRGMVYIILGHPNNVDRYPFETNSKPYEVWYYNEINYRFVFVDQTGFGDYRLDPSTPLWILKDRRR